MRLATFLMLLVVCCSCGAVVVQKSPIIFPDVAEVFRRPDDLKQTMLFRPRDGNGPFPAVVLLHTCAGVGPHIYDWASRFTHAGYVVLILDSLTPRRVSDNCLGASAPVTLDMITADAAGALAHLRALPIVAPDRLAVVGFSWGAIAALHLAGARHQRRLTPAVTGLRAIASFYPSCKFGLESHISTPTRLFLGELDNETPPDSCIRAVDSMKKSNEPIDYKVYPATTHSFDAVGNGVNGRSIYHGKNGPYFYRYNKDATEDAWRETSAFFEKEMNN